MIYFFYGADSFRLRQKLNNEIARYKAKHKSGLNFGRFDLGQEESLDKLKNFINSYSMFVEKKLGVVEGVFETATAVQDELVSFLENSGIIKDQEKFLIITQSMRLNEDKRAKEKYLLKASEKEIFKKLIGRNFNSEEFDLLSGAKLENWIKKEVENQEGKIDNLAVRKLAAYVGADLWQMTNEVSKLISYKVDKVIMEGDVDELVSAKIEADIFKAVDSLATRNKTATFGLLHKNLAAGETEIAIFGMLIYQFRNLLLVKSQIEQGVSFYDLQKKLKMHPFVLRKTFEQSKNFSFVALKKIYERLAGLDMGIKSGQIEPQAALDLVVAEITG